MPAKKINKLIPNRVVEVSLVDEPCVPGAFVVYAKRRGKEIGLNFTPLLATDFIKAEVVQRARRKVDQAIGEKAAQLATNPATHAAQELDAFAKKIAAKEGCSYAQGYSRAAKRWPELYDKSRP